MTITNLSKIKKVEKYIAHRPQTPLRFSRSSKKIKFTGDLDALVIDILNSTHRHWSININNIHETSPGRRRSVLDIWRHALTYDPDITIYAVMRSLFSLGNKDLLIGGFYCGNIGRRVFRSRESYRFGNFWGERDQDEFGLSFSDWETIGLL